MKKGEYILFDIPEATTYEITIYDGPKPSKSHSLIIHSRSSKVGYASDLQHAYQIIKEHAEKELVTKGLRLAKEVSMINEMLNKTVYISDWIQLFRKK